MSFFDLNPDQKELNDYHRNTLKQIMSKLDHELYSCGCQECQEIDNAWRTATDTLNNHEYIKHLDLELLNPAIETLEIYLEKQQSA